MYCDWPGSNGGHCHGTTRAAVGLGIQKPDKRILDWNKPSLVVYINSVMQYA